MKRTCSVFLIPLLVSCSTSDSSLLSDKSDLQAKFDRWNQILTERISNEDQVFEDNQGTEVDDMVADVNAKIRGKTPSVKKFNREIEAGLVTRVGTIREYRVGDEAIYISQDLRVKFTDRERQPYIVHDIEMAVFVPPMLKKKLKKTYHVHLSDDLGPRESEIILTTTKPDGPDGKVTLVEDKFEFTAEGVIQTTGHIDRSAVEGYYHTRFVGSVMGSSRATRDIPVLFDLDRGIMWAKFEHLGKKQVFDPNIGARADLESYKLEIFRQGELIADDKYYYSKESQFLYWLRDGVVVQAVAKEVWDEAPLLSMILTGSPE